ncbi:alpha-glucuronidase [Anaerocolumna sedimenticola]|uniref:Xylan alpha-1,2-glucuronidase n=1 Tax=Anaerocolumna sedimenticola TaxID=2696063 RepID=A0A6P1TL97_9FIRM|nr:alpha-glucuronidase family glycosyl hydrolase [Anaerocolumna sedimenticola]QHQ60902.1 alpha-glucuronidase [Anaerocolumna sedimenticola]
MEYTQCWLQYKKISDVNKLDVNVYCGETGRLIDRIYEELALGFWDMYHRKIKISGGAANTGTGNGIVLTVNEKSSLGPEGYSLKSNRGRCIIEADTQVGLLYGTFALLRNLQTGESKAPKPAANFDNWSWEEEKIPSNPLRMLNHWDNMDGSIERGYSGESFFFHDNEIIVNDRTRAYARLMASVGINAVVINNVNVKDAATELITERYYTQLRKLADIFESYAIKLYLSINFASPVELGELDTADPLDERVGKWWREKAEEIWKNLPGLGGFLVKADSEGRPGPYTYGRTHSEGANMLAEAVKPHGGTIIWRCFVYNCRQDWRDKITDRAKAAYDNFKPLDGTFADNVILQIKNGPMDFQVREPVSPLLGGLSKTNMILEFQIAQEYTGQQKHVCFLIPWFKEVLNFDMYCKEKLSTVGDLVSGKTYHQVKCGIAAVANTGNDNNWTGHDLAAANLYGFGRLAFDTGLSSERIAKEWIALTYGFEEKVVKNINKILQMSWPAYEKYTSPLGIGWMVTPHTHYGPSVDGYEYDSWGTYHRADHFGIGVDRSNKGTGYCSQYNPPLDTIYGDKETCPEELLLFFHYVDYSYTLSSGKTLLQHIYDSHFEGVEDVEKMICLWEEIKEAMDMDSYNNVILKLNEQLNSAKEWRDVINSYFYRKTGIPDVKGRNIY